MYEGFVLTILNDKNKINDRQILVLGDLPNKPNALTLYEYWDDKRDDRAFPSLQDINLIDFWRIAVVLLSRIVILSFLRH
jgi:hypothetical protein